MNGENPVALAPLWTSRWLCYVCQKRHGVKTKATTRVFAGVGAGGFPACYKHTIDAESDALQNLKREDISSDFTVTAYEVLEDEHGFPKLGRKLWTAKRREDKFP